MSPRPVDPGYIAAAKRIVESDAAWATLRTKIERAAVKMLSQGCLHEEWEPELDRAMTRAQRVLFSQE